jgi:putative oxidoreductase
MSLKEVCSAWSPRLLSVMRIMAGLLFLQHGTAKFLGIPYIERMANLPAFSQSWNAGLIELVGGTLLVLGLFTRPVAFICSGTMAFAYFLAHAPRSFYPIMNGGELAALYCFVFLYLAAAGGGSWSLDALRKRA